MKPRLSLLCLLILLPTLSAQAGVAVLLHGLLGSSNSWEQSGAVHALHEQGWERAGRVQSGGPSGVLLSRPLSPPRGNRLLYLADIPSLIPLQEQSELLEQILLTLLNHHPEEPIYLIGHSAGGVVSRIVTVRNNVPTLAGLITIATPHLGSPYANYAYDLATLPFPLRIVPKLLAHEKYQVLRRSRHMIKGLVIAKPGTYLHWLNRQPHPDIEYVSIVRRQSRSRAKSALVPFWSQDMNNIPTLPRQSTIVPTFAPHRITLQDGYLLGALLNQLVSRNIYN